MVFGVHPGCDGSLGGDSGAADDEVLAIDVFGVAVGVVAGGTPRSAVGASMRIETN